MIDKYFTEFHCFRRISVGIKRFKRRNQEKYCYNAKKVIFHHEKTPAHTSFIAMAKLHELLYELLSYPPCSVGDILTKKKWMLGNIFSSNNEVNKRLF